MSRSGPQSTARQALDPTFVALMVESIAHMKLPAGKVEFAKAVLRFALKYAAMKQAGFDLVPKEKP